MTRTELLPGPPKPSRNRIPNSITGLISFASEAFIGATGFFPKEAKSKKSRPAPLGRDFFLVQAYSCKLNMT